MAEEHPEGGGAERFSAIRALLTEIQGPQLPDYQGLGQFWADHKTLLRAELYGQRLIAPPPDGDASSSPADGCCGADDSEEAGGGRNSAGGCWPSGGGRRLPGFAPDTRRSAASALIRGLRGEAPFDHSVFPPLLWQAARQATATEIERIAAWIDNGALDDDDEGHAQLLAVEHQTRSANAKLFALAQGADRHQPAVNSTNSSKLDAKGLRVRKEVNSLQPAELARLRDAIACMQTYNAHWQDERSFDFWARIHTSSCQHGWEQFLPWHRLYLYFFEQMLQDFDPLITLPYWAWSDYAAENRASFNNTTFDLGVLPEAYRCWLDSAAVSRLAALGTLTAEQLSALEQLAQQGTLFNSGLRLLRAAKVDYAVERDPVSGQARWTPTIAAIYTELRRINPLWFPNRWPGAMGSAAAYPTAADIRLLLDVPHWADFGGGPEADHYFGHLEQVHNGMHNFSGGTNPNYPRKSNSAWQQIYAELKIAQPDPQNRDNPPYGWMTDNRITAYDPLFWAHHSNVDRIWWQWQALHPHGVPMQQDGVLAPWSLTVGDTLDAAKLGYEYLRNSYHFETSPRVGMARFNGAPAGVDATTLDVFRKAEVRLHRVQRANLPSAQVRVFLNDPTADATTPTSGNANFCGQLNLFHGGCYGGPGHCDMPLDKSRPFDRRTLHHNEPRNYRLDATETARALLSSGADDLSVHLVAVGLDGEPVDDALYLDGVSLNFMD